MVRTILLCHRQTDRKLDAFDSSPAIREFAVPTTRWLRVSRGKTIEFHVCWQVTCVSTDLSRVAAVPFVVEPNNWILKTTSRVYSPTHTHITTQVLLPEEAILFFCCGLLGLFLVYLGSLLYARFAQPSSLSSCVRECKERCNQRGGHAIFHFYNKVFFFHAVVP